MTERRPRGRPRAFNDTTEQNTVQSLDRAVTVLEALALKGRTLTELAAALDQSPATLYRILVTLAARQMVESDPAEQTWHIGPRCFQIGSFFLRRTSLVERARPYLRRLMEATGETANLGIARADQVLFVAQVETHATIRAFFPPGTQSPLHASGIGKAMMAAYGDARLDALLKRAPLTGYTATTLTDPALLRQDLQATRTRGYAIDNEERTEGMRCIAAAIFDAPGEPVGGISVSGPSSRMNAAVMATAGALVRAAAAEISQGMGAGGAGPTAVSAQRP